MLPFDLPAPMGFKDQPKWNGNEFELGEIRLPILEYSENFIGWSDDLTALHEDSLGSSHPIDVASRKMAIKAVTKYLAANPQSTILEIGCSSGFLLEELANTFPSASITGADVVKEPLYRLHKKLPKLPLLRFDLLSCPLPKESFDIIIMLNVLEHIGDDKLALSNAYKLLKPGGLIVIEVPAGPYLFDSYDRELQHFRRYSSSELLSKLNQAGFKVTQKSHLGFFVFPAFCLIKIINKFTKAKKNKNVVKEKAVNTSSSKLLAYTLSLEQGKFSNLPLPFGIRVLMTAQKPIFI